MAFDETGHIWMNGEFVPWKNANVHICSHVIHYGSSVFEGIRAYNIGGKAGVFRLGQHIRRLFDSAKIYRMAIPFTREEIEQACLDTIRKNGFNECYIRPVVYRGYESLGVHPGACPIDVSIITWKWGKYLGQEAIEKGVDVCTSSWNRIGPNTLPAMAKCGANYMNAQLIKMEAVANGYVEGIALDVEGNVSEGSGENIFLVRDGVLFTPSISSSVLPGITRNCVLTFARELGIAFVERKISREELYVADEVFFTGTAAEISPIKSIDKIPVGEGSRGPVTERLQTRFFSYLDGREEDRYGWITLVE
jgi:branched-chain amino acid aminotransferase